MSDLTREQAIAEMEAYINEERVYVGTSTLDRWLTALRAPAQEQAGGEDLWRALVNAVPHVVLCGVAGPVEDHHALMDIRDRLECSEEIALRLLRQARKEFPYLLTVTNVDYFTG